MIQNLLIYLCRCKIKPFVKEMQRNVVNMVRQEKKLLMNDKSFYNFPSVELLLQEFDNCDAHYSQCSYK